MFEGVMSYMSKGETRGSMNEFIDSILDKTTWDIARDELTVRKDNLASCILLTFSVRNICLTS